MELNEEILHKLQRKQLEILLEFDRVCNEMGLNYSISSGTLLGAIRHKGFIPWDDDVDVVMLREDYEKFLEEGKRYLPKNYFIQTYENDKNYPHNFAKIVDISTTLREGYTSNIDMINGIFIDIFPIDRVSSNKIIRRIDNLLLSIIYLVKHSSNPGWIKKTKRGYNRLIKYCILPLSRCIGTRRLNRLETYIKTKNNKEGNNYTYGDNYVIPLINLNKAMLLPIEIFSDCEYIDFEEYKVKAIKEYDIYLTAIYGDYMQLPPTEKRKPTHNIVELKF